jgi:hypothetical protein
MAAFAIALVSLHLLLALVASCIVVQGETWEGRLGALVMLSTAVATVAYIVAVTS